MKKLFLLLCAVIFVAGCSMNNAPSSLEGEKVVNEGVSTSALNSYNYYFGMLHNHSNVSDGTGSPAANYTYARDVAKLDFFSLADHCGAINSSEWSAIKSAARNAHREGSFVAFHGFEWTSSRLGHVAIINTSDMTSVRNSSTDTFPELVSWLNRREGIAYFNHPGRQDRGNEFSHFATTPSDKFVGMELWNKTTGFSRYYYNDGYYRNDGNKGYYDEAISRGWMIGASGSDDNHRGTHGTRSGYRMGVLAPSLTKSAIYAALKARRTFSTSDKNLKLYFGVNNRVMGSVISPGTYTALVEASDNESFRKAELIKNGSVIKTWTASGNTISFNYTVSGSNNDYFYVRVKQTDGGEAISSPVYVRGTGGGDTQAPTVPGNLRSANVTSSSVTLDWSRSVDNKVVTGYKVYQDGIYIKTVTSTSTTMTGLTSGRTYKFEVSAVDAAGNESAKAVITVRLGNGGDTQAPSVPSGLRSGTVTSSSVALSWTGSTDNVGVTGYKVYVDGVYNKTVTSTSATVSSLKAATTYRFEVSAVDAAGNESGKTALSVKTKDGGTTPGNEWKPYVNYKVGDKAVYSGVTYTCRMAHTSLPGWTPAVVPALWSK